MRETDVFTLEAEAQLQELHNAIDSMDISGSGDTRVSKTEIERCFNEHLGISQPEAAVNPNTTQLQVHSDAEVEPMAVPMPTSDNELRIDLPFKAAILPVPAGNRGHSIDFINDTFVVTLPTDGETRPAQPEVITIPDNVLSFPILHSDIQLNKGMDTLVQNSGLLTGADKVDMNMSDSLFTRDETRLTDVDSGFVVLQNLTHARDKLAGLSVELRGKNFKSLHKNLQTDYTRALREYKSAYQASEHERTAALWVENDGEDSFDGQFAASNKREHELFLEAEKAAYEKKNPETNYLVGKWATYGSVKRFVIGATTGAGLAALAMPVATGAAGLFIGGLTYKAAKSLGMYKLNKKAGVISAYDKKAKEDNAKAAAVETKVGGNLPASIASSNQLVETINGRVEADRKENRRRLILAVGSVAIGAVAGSLLHDRLSGRGRSGNSRSKLPGVTVKPEPTSDTVSIGKLPPAFPRPVSETQLPVRPHAPYIPRTGDAIPQSTGANSQHLPGTGIHTGDEHPPYIPKPSEPQIPAGGAEASPISGTGVTRIPIDAPITPQINTEQLTWDVAHEFARGNEVQVIQKGIDDYNNLRGTHFALQPHNGSRWIIDSVSGRSINPTEMFMLNELMIDDELLPATT